MELNRDALFCSKSNFDSSYQPIMGIIDQDFQVCTSDLSYLSICQNKHDEYRGNIPNSDSTAKFVADLCTPSIDLQNLRCSLSQIR
jgi:hypothetical protein